MDKAKRILALLAVISFYVCNPPKEKVRLGLDLNGGTSFTLGPDTNRLVLRRYLKNFLKLKM